MAKTSSLSEGALHLVARRFAVLGEPMRLRLLQLLMAAEQLRGAAGRGARWGGSNSRTPRGHDEP